MQREKDRHRQTERQRDGDERVSLALSLALAVASVCVCVFLWRCGRRRSQTNKRRSSSTGASERILKAPVSVCACVFLGVESSWWWCLCARARLERESAQGAKILDFSPWRICLPMCVCVCVQNAAQYTEFKGRKTRHSLQILCKSASLTAFWHWVRVSASKQRHVPMCLLRVKTFYSPTHRQTPFSTGLAYTRLTSSGRRRGESGLGKERTEAGLAACPSPQ